MTSPRRIVVVGNGIAGITAADTLRAQGFEGEITLVGDEAVPAYSRPALSKALLRDEKDLTSHLLPPPRHGATELLGVRATSLDVVSRTVELDHSERLPFDDLVIATGCRPRRLSQPDDDSGELTLRTLDEALHLRERVRASRSVIVVGGGPLGMEIASGALDAGCEVTLVSHGAPLIVQLGEYLSEVFVLAARDHGLRIVDAAAVGVSASGRAGRVTMADGSVLEADVVVTAAGDLPNVEWLASSGLLTDGRLVTDAYGRVAPGVFAAGDVAWGPTPLGVRRVPLWNSAIEHAQVAAAHLLNADAPPVQTHPYFWTEGFGLAVKAVGHLPFVGEPLLVDSTADGGSLVQWASGPEGLGAAAAINYRIPIPKLRRLGEGLAAGVT